MTTSVLIVCLGNICRSPAGETVLSDLATGMAGLDLYVESCGTGDWNLGFPPDSRMQEVAKQRGFALEGVARGLRESDFERFDYILAVDQEILHVVRMRAPISHSAEIRLLSDYSPAFRGQNIPDPYYGSAREFELALDMIEDSCRGFLDYLASDRQ